MNNPRYLLSIYCTLTICTAWAQTDFEFHQMAKLSKAQLDYNSAVKMMSKAIDIAPANTEYYIERGHLYLGLEKNRKAKKDFNAALAIDSMNIEPWIGKSLCHLYKEELDSALMLAYIADILAETKFEQARAGSLIGEVLFTKNEDKAAFRYFNESLQLDTNNNSGFKKAALIALKYDDFNQAERLLLRAMHNDARDLEVLINLGYTYNNLGQFKLAIKHCNLALSYDPTHPFARSNRARAYFKLGQNKRALEDINLSLKNYGTNPTAYVYKGEILLDEGGNEETNKACKCFFTALNLGYNGGSDDDFQQMVAEHCSE